jgi:hypothetical protein
MTTSCNCDRGAALVVVLLIMMLLAVVAGGLITLSTTETLISAAHRHAHEAAHGADAALERALLDLALLPDWSPLLVPSPGNVVSTFTDGAVTPIGPDGRRIELSALTADRQRESDARDGPRFGANSPQWRLLAHAPIHHLAPAVTALPVYLVVWVADDGPDGDDDPTHDANQRVLLHAVAFGGAGTRRSVEALVERTVEGVIRLRAWHRPR